MPTDTSYGSYTRSRITRLLLKSGFTGIALRRERRLQDRFYKDLLAKTPPASLELRLKIKSDWEMNDRESLEELRHLLSQKLIATAHRIQVPTPVDRSNSEMDHYKHGDITGEWMLTDHGVRVLRQRIREEQRERRDIVVSWVTAVGGTTLGLIGALTGLIAVWKQ